MRRIFLHDTESGTIVKSAQSIVRYHILVVARSTLSNYSVQICWRVEFAWTGQSRARKHTVQNGCDDVLVVFVEPHGDVIAYHLKVADGRRGGPSTL